MSTEINNYFDKVFATKEGQKFKKYCDEYTIWDVLGMFRYEDANTNFLASFLDAKKDIFVLGTEPISNFINLICEKDKTKIKGDFSNIGNLKKDDIKISIRQTYKKPTCRPDLVIILKDQYLIFLEAKIEAGESRKDQCKEYYDIAQKDYPNSAFIYLSLSSDDEISAEQYIKITYQDLIDKLYEPLKEKIKNKNKDLLNQYLKGFIYLVKDNYISDNFKMPITEEIRTLVKEIYSKQQKNIDEFINKREKFNCVSADVEIFFIVLYEILNNDNKDLANKIKNKYHREGIVLIDKNNNFKKITKLGKIMEYLITKKLIDDKKMKIDDINDLATNKFKYLYKIEEFKYQNFTKNQEDFYTDITLNNENYKILISYNYPEVIDFLNTLESLNIVLEGIEIRGKISDDVIYPKKINI